MNSLCLLAAGRVDPPAHVFHLLVGLHLVGPVAKASTQCLTEGFLGLVLVTLRRRQPLAQVLTKTDTGHQALGAFPDIAAEVVVLVAELVVHQRRGASDVRRVGLLVDVVAALHGLGQLGPGVGGAGHQEQGDQRR